MAYSANRRIERSRGSACHRGGATGESSPRESFCDVDRTCSLSVAPSQLRPFGHPAFHSDMDRVHRLEHRHCDVWQWVGLVDDEPKCGAATKIGRERRLVDRMRRRLPKLAPFGPRAMSVLRSLLGANRTYRRQPISVAINLSETLPLAQESFACAPPIGYHKRETPGSAGEAV
jgi:hypothetical protein